MNLEFLTTILIIYLPATLCTIVGLITLVETDRFFKWLHYRSLLAKYPDKDVMYSHLQMYFIPGMDVEVQPARDLRLRVMTLIYQRVGIILNVTDVPLGYGRYKV